MILRGFYLGVDLLRKPIKSLIWIFWDSSSLLRDSTYFLRGDSFMLYFVKDKKLDELMIEFILLDLFLDDLYQLTFINNFCLIVI